MMKNIFYKIRQLLGSKERSVSRVSEFYSLSNDDRSAIMREALIESGKDQKKVLDRYEKKFAKQ